MTSVLRTDNLEYQPHSENISRVKGSSKKCYKPTRNTCRDGVAELDQIRDLHRANACSLYSCLPTKKIMQKRALLDDDGNLVPIANHGLRINQGGQTTNTGYLYQQRDIVDDAKLMDALRKNNPLATNVVIRIAEENRNLYSKSTDWNGNMSGMPCIPCKPIKPPCVTKTCKKADPFFHITGLGSDVSEYKSDLRSLGQAIQMREVVKDEDFQKGSLTAKSVTEAQFMAGVQAQGQGQEADQEADLNFKMEDLPTSTPRRRGPKPGSKNKPKTEAPAGEAPRSKSTRSGRVQAQRTTSRREKDQL